MEPDTDTPARKDRTRQLGVIAWYTRESGGLFRVAHPDFATTDEATAWLRKALESGEQSGTEYHLHREVQIVRPKVETVRKVTWIEPVAEVVAAVLVLVCWPFLLASLFGGTP